MPTTMTFLMRRCAAIALLAAAATPAAAVDEADLLPVDQAFALTASAPGRDRIELHWRIADGYYLYRHRIKAVPQGDGFVPAPLQLPKGHPKHDEFFGDVETYRDDVTAILPGTASAGTERVSVQVTYQGCADVGVCYPPQRRTVDVALPVAAAATGGDGGLALPGRKPALGLVPLPGTSQGAGEPLPPEQAFGFEAIPGDGNTLLLRFTPAPGYYLYRDKTTLRLDGADGIAAGTPRWPPGVAHHDEYFGDVVVYFDQVDVPLPLRRSRPDAADAVLTATFQGCQSDGICYPPMTRTIRLSIPAGSVAPAGASDAPRDTAAPAAATPPQAEDSRLAAALAGGNRLWALLVFFGLGLGLAFTPCVLPMIPILSGLIAGQGTRVGTARALALSLVYVVANALVFTVAGIVAGLVGANLQVAFQQPWIIAAFAALFVALALSSFGFYELQLPAALRARLGAISDHQRGGSLAGVAAMGALSALIVGPCVAPPLAAAVLYISQTHDPAFGGVALFLLAMGMGLPLLAFGVAAGRGIPTSGPWMTAVQRAFGFVFLGLAIWMLSRILPDAVVLGLWGALAIAAALALGLLRGDHAPHGRGRALAQFAGLLLLIAGAAEIAGALGGGRDPLQPLAGVLGASAPARLPFRAIKSNADLDAALADARAAGKPVMFDFYADWCVSCKEMEKYTFTEPAVQAALAGFVLLQADVTANDDVDQALMRRYGIVGPPATLFFVDGRERRELRLVGYEKPAPFIARVGHATGGTATDAQAAAR